MILTATINEVKRRVTFDNPNAVVAVKGDYEVNGVAFAFPAIYEDDFDLSTAVKTVYYKATDGIIYNHVVTDTDTDTGYPLWVFKDEINKGAYGDVEFALVCDKVEGGNIVKRWVSMITAFRVQKSIEIDESEQEDNEQTYSERLAYLMTQMANMQTSVTTASESASAALTKANAVDERLNNIIIESGTSDAEVVAARTNSDTGQAYSTLGTRLDTEYSEIKEDLNAKQDALTFDTTPTANSSNPVTSGGVAKALTNVTVPVDDTLSQEGEAADAKATGDAIENLTERVNSISPSETVSGTLVNFEADETNAITSVTLDSESETVTIVRCGKNLLPSDGTTQLSPDVLTVVKNDDGSLTINGTSPGGGTARYTVSLAAPIPSGTYYVNFEEISGTASSALGFRVLNSSGAQVAGKQGPGSATFTNDVGTVFFHIGASGDTYSNYTIRMMLCEASLEDRSYVPYDGESYSVSNPLTFKDIAGMSLLTGTNYIYSDATSMSVKYSTNKDTTEAIRDDLGENSSLAAEYSASSTYAVGAYVLYDGTIYQCNTPITIAEAWTAAHWTAKDVSSVLADANARLDMLVTMQEVQEDEPTEGIVQVVDLSKLNWTTNSQGKYSGKLTDYIILKGDGDYYQNPCGVAVNEGGSWRLLYARFYDAYNNQLTLTNIKNGSTQEHLTLFGGLENAAHFTIENGRTLKYYQGETLTNTYTTEADIARIYGNADFQHFDNDTTKFGITYGGKSTSYVPYEGSAEPVYEYNYVPKMAKYVEEYMKAHGTAVDNNIFNYVYPEAGNTEFVNAIKYYHSRKEREDNNIVRIGSFNKYVSRGSTNYPVIKQELADYSVDMCGFQESDLTISDGVITNRIETALRGWQFPHGCDVSINTGKGFVSHWKILSSEALELLTTSRGISYAIKCVVELPEYKMYSNVINNKPTLSVYTYHGIAYNAAIDGVMTTSKQIRLMEISALLNFISEDTSDFIVIVGDTNAFESGFDIHTGTHEEWELFRQAGYTPALSGEYSTVTADLAGKYFALADNNKVYCIAAYDQIFIGQNISVIETNVVDSNLYPVEALSGAPVSDHCMVYADLKFDFDTIMQNKLKDIAATEPWW